MMKIEFTKDYIGQCRDIYHQAPERNVSNTVIQTVPGTS